MTIEGGAGNDTIDLGGGSNSVASNGLVEDSLGNNFSIQNIQAIPRLLQARATIP